MSTCVSAQYLMHHYDYFLITVIDITYSTIDGAVGFTALGSLKCDGNENYLYECLSDFDYLNYCDHSMDVTLSCPCKYIGY